MAEIHGIGPTAQAALADAYAKRWATAQAIGTLAGLESRRLVSDAGVVLYVVGSRTFETLESVEQWLGVTEGKQT